MILSVAAQTFSRTCEKAPKLCVDRFANFEFEKLITGTIVAPA